MTKVLLWRHGGQHVVSANGHAKTEAGCAAVSMLMTTLAGYLSNIRCKVDLLRLESGDAALAWRGRSREARAAWDFACIGFEQFEQSYPDEVQVKVDDG